MNASLGHCPAAAAISPCPGTAQWDGCPPQLSDAPGHQLVSLEQGQIEVEWILS